MSRWDEPEKLMRQENPQRLAEDGWDNESLRADRQVDTAVVSEQRSPS